MAKTKPSRPEVTGPLAEYAGGFRAELARLGYTPLSAACQMRLMAHLSRWMTAEGLGVLDLDTPAAERYFAARRSAGYANERTVAALGPLLGYLRGLGAVPLPSAEPVTEAGLLLDRFAAYLASERGLAPRTVALNVRLARPFLQQRALARDGHLDLGHLTAAEVRAFVLDRARRQPRSAKRVVTALRSLLRFLHVDGILAVPLAGAVPSPAGHALAGLPRALEPGQVEAIPPAGLTSGRSGLHGPFARTPLQGLHRSYGPSRPCASRYSAPRGVCRLGSSLSQPGGQLHPFRLTGGSEATGSPVPCQRLRRAHATFTPDAISATRRQLPD